MFRATGRFNQTASKGINKNTSTYACMIGGPTHSLSERHSCQSGMWLRRTEGKVCYAWLRCISYSPVLGLQVIRVSSLFSCRTSICWCPRIGAALNIHGTKPYDALRTYAHQPAVHASPHPRGQLHFLSPRSKAPAIIQQRRKQAATLQTFVVCSRAPSRSTAPQILFRPR